MSNALLELLKKKKQSLTANRRAKTVKPEDGTSRWRILPGWDEKNPAFFHDFGQHFIKDTMGEIKAVYICVDKTFGKPCSICNELTRAINNTTDDGMVELLKGARASGRVLMNALHISGKDPSEPAILEVAPSVFESIINIVQEWGPEVLDLKDGKDIIIERNGKGKLTKYTVQVAAKSAAVDPSVMKKVANLDDYVAQESEENANRALSNLSAITGFLPSPSRTALPTAAHVATLRDISIDAEVIEESDADDDALRALEESTKSEEVKAVKPKVEAKKPEPTPAAAPKVAESTGSSELDDLLAELGG